MRRQSTNNPAQNRETAVPCSGTDLICAMREEIRSLGSMDRQVLAKWLRRRNPSFLADDLELLNFTLPRTFKSE